MKITYTDIQLRDSKGSLLGLAPDVTLQTPDWQGTVRWLYEHLRAEGHVFDNASYSHQVEGMNMSHTHNRAKG